MKTLHYRRHSIEDGIVKDTIGPKGLRLARYEGGVLHDDGFEIHWLFHGPLVRTAQTALAFCQGLCGILPETMPVVLEIGTEELFREIATEQFRVAVKAGQSNFQALVNVHPADKTDGWAKQALKGVQFMFAQMEDGETAIAFGHSPVIELAAWALGVNQGEELPAGWQKLADMEGLIFTCDDDRIHITDKISVQPNVTA